MPLEIKNVNYIYGEGSGFEKQALNDVTVCIERGEFVGLIGHTGSGKSTLTQMCNGLLRPKTGTILFDGQDIWASGFKMQTLRQKVGLVFQYPEHQLFEETVLKDVCYGPKNLGLKKEECIAQAKEALELVKFPEELYEASPFDLSGGQKRRAAIAGVLAMRPDYLILDEPTAGLDPRGRDEILDMIQALRAETGMAVVLVSHSMEDVAKYVGRLLVMNHGELVYDDTPKEVFKHYKELEAMGLAAPEITYIMNALQEKGLNVDVTAATVAQGRDSILQAIQAGKGLC